MPKPSRPLLPYFVTELSQGIYKENLARPLHRFFFHRVSHVWPQEVSMPKKSPVWWEDKPSQIQPGGCLNPRGEGIWRYLHSWQDGQGLCKSQPWNKIEIDPLTLLLPCHVLVGWSSPHIPDSCWPSPWLIPTRCAFCQRCWVCASAPQYRNCWWIHLLKFSCVFFPHFKSEKVKMINWLGIVSNSTNGFPLIFTLLKIMQCTYGDILHIYSSLCTIYQQAVQQAGDGGPSHHRWCSQGHQAVLWRWGKRDLSHYYKNKGCSRPEFYLVETWKNKFMNVCRGWNKSHCNN